MQACCIRSLIKVIIKFDVIKLEHILIKCGNISAIILKKILILHSQTKYIEISYFI